MKRISIQKSTGKIIEMQLGGDDRPDLMEARLDTLRQNALNAGHRESDIEVKWVTPEEYAALVAAVPPPPITRLSMRQARLQMLAIGVLDDVEDAIAQAGQAAQIQWEYATTVDRDNALFQSIKTALGFTDEQEEQFFNEGSEL